METLESCDLLFVTQFFQINHASFYDDSPAAVITVSTRRPNAAASLGDNEISVVGRINPTGASPCNPPWHS
jgi:hypothetical protein